MNEPTTESTGLLARLRANETINKLSRGKPDLIIFGAPIALIVLIVAIAAGAAVMLGGGGGDEEQVVTTPTSASATNTPEGDATATPASGGFLTPIAVDPGDVLTLNDLANRGAGPPGRGPFTGERLVIPSIGVDAPFTIKTVPSNGVMPNPNGPEDVAYYDFGGFAGMGGVPGLGGNVVLAGHVDYINVGPAVFWDIAKLQAGDVIEIHLDDGTVARYQVEFNKHIGADAAPWDAIVAGTAEESVTLITCTGEFSAGHYSDRTIVWGRRIA
jgi:LPXTG-site transpeptidase (sortase) family protein